MENNWKEVQLGSLLTTITKGTTPPRGKGFVENGINYIKSESISYDGQIDEKKFAHIDVETHDKFRRSQLQEDDIMFSMAGMFLGKNAVVSARYLPANTNQALAILRIDKSLAIPRYISYCLRDPVMISYINSMSAQSAQPNINFKEISSLVIKLPSLKVQESITHILSTLDDKIELNRQMNQILAKMAQALYKSWFVDFDPVIDNALNAGNEIPEPLLRKADRRLDLGTKRKSLSKDIQALFPDEFKYSEVLGNWVPKDWEVKPLEHCLQINPAVKLLKGTTAKFVDMKSLPTEGYIISDYVIKEFKNGGAKFQQGDVLLARITPCLENGKTGIIDFLSEGEAAFGSTEFIVLRGKDEIRTPLVACLARESSVRNHCIQSMVGSSGRQRVQIAAFNNYFLATPSAEILREFHINTEHLFKKMTSLSKGTKSLINMRDALLPKLISGSLTLKNTIACK